MPTRKYLTESEVNRLLIAALKGVNPERDYCLILMCYIHGCRVSEIINWRLSDVDMVSNSIYIHRLKNGLSTTHPLYPIEKGVLSDWIAKRNTYKNSHSDWVFLSRNGNRISRQRMYALMRQCSELAGLSIDAHPHMLRHACGYALADRGMDTRLIQDYLGHRNIQHTVHYTASNAGRFYRIWREKN